MNAEADTMQDAPGTDPARSDVAAPEAGGQPPQDAGAFRGSAPPEAAQAPPPPRRSRAAVALPWVIAFLALAAAAFSTWQWQELAAREGRADTARAAALAFVTDLTNWDASDGLDDEIATLREQGTGPFLDEIDLVFGGDELTAQLREANVSASGDVEEAFVQDLGDDTAEVFAVVSVTYSAPEMSDEPRPVVFPAQIVLEEQGQGWLVRQVSVPNSDQIGQLMAPPPETTEG